MSNATSTALPLVGVRRAALSPVSGWQLTGTTGEDHEPGRISRRRAAPVAAIAFVLALTAGAGSVLASRGGGPASTPATRPAARYLVQPGDTLWAISARFHGRYAQSDYVDRLIDVNGGTALQIGELVVLP